MLSFLTHHSNYFANMLKYSKSKRFAMDIFIYCLKDPVTFAVRYIGKTNNLKIRLAKHRLAQGANPEKNAWINGLKSCGLDPVLGVLEIVNESTWADAEKRWIAYGRTVGWNLLNADDGGWGGVNPKPETLARMRNAHLGKPLSLMAREKVRMAVKGRKLSDAAKEKLKKRPHTWGWKISASKMGHPVTDESRQKMSQSRIAYFDEKGRQFDRVLAHLQTHPEDKTLSCRALGRKLSVAHSIVSQVFKSLNIEVKSRGKKE